MNSPDRQTLTFRDVIRERPAMYAGTIWDGFAANFCAKSLITNAVQFRHASTAHLQIERDGTFHLIDDGEPLPSDIHSWTTLCRTEAALANWRTAPAGIDLSVIAALSESFIVRTSEKVLTFRSGIPEQGSDLTGLLGQQRIRTRLDPGVFSNCYRPCTFTLFSWARDYAATSPGTTIRVESTEVGARSFAYPMGISGLLEELDAHRTRAHAEVISFDAVDDCRTLSLALRFCHTGSKEYVSFVNHERTGSNGAHIDGARDGIRKALGKSNSHLPFTVCISVTDPKPQWASSTKECLLGREVQEFASKSVLQNRDSILQVVQSIGVR